MLDSIIKIASATQSVRVADPIYNATRAAELTAMAYENSAEIIVFPELSISCATAGDLFLQSAFLEECERAVSLYLEKTAKLDVLAFIGAPVRHFSKLYNATLAVHKGEILAIYFKDTLTLDEKRYFNLPEVNSVQLTYASKKIDVSLNTVLFDKALSPLKIYVCHGDSLLSNKSNLSRAASSGATLIISPNAFYEELGASERIKTAACALSYINKAAIVTASPSVGESTTDFVYSGRALSALCGELASEKDAFSNDEILYSVIDLEIIEKDRIQSGEFNEKKDELFSYVPFEIEQKKTEFDTLDKFPFFPSDKEKRDGYARLTLRMQINALARRFTASRSKTLVIGVSGGLDSTLALLVCVGACDVLSLDRKNIIAVTMPCFGTSSRTKNNAVELSRSLGVSLRTVDIKQSVLQHFEDISHPCDSYNVVYENAQARERTQVLMDIANELSGIVVGTGDLSELALGFATYNGDQMSNYGVNAGISKTYLRVIVDYCARNATKEIADTLYDILNTPVSPELLPLVDGKLAQCTEGIVGPYELNDFFLYYISRYGFSPRKIKRLALVAFKDEYDEKTVDGWLRIFLRRYVTQQFKRSAMPDGVKIGEVSLSPRGGLKMPSDAYYDFLIRSLDGEI